MEEDIYANLSGNDLGEEIEKLRDQNNLLQNHVQSLECDIEKLCARITEMKDTQNNLTRNISELFKTAKAEIERKNRTINDLRTQLEQHSMQRKLPTTREGEYHPARVQPNVKRLRRDNLFKEQISNVENNGRKRTASNREWVTSPHRSRSGDRIHKIDREEFDKKQNAFRHEKTSESKHKVLKSIPRVETMNVDPKKEPKQVVVEEKIKSKSSTIQNCKSTAKGDVTKNNVEIVAKKEKHEQKQKQNDRFEHELHGRKAENSEKKSSFDLKITSKKKLEKNNIKRKDIEQLPKIGEALVENAVKCVEVKPECQKPAQSKNENKKEVCVSKRKCEGKNEKEVDSQKIAEVLFGQELDETEIGSSMNVENIEVEEDVLKPDQVCLEENKEKNEKYKLEEKEKKGNTEKSKQLFKEETKVSIDLKILPGQRLTQEKKSQETDDELQKIEKFLYEHKNLEDSTKKSNVKVKQPHQKSTDVSKADKKKESNTSKISSETPLIAAVKENRESELIEEIGKSNRENTEHKETKLEKKQMLNNKENVKVKCDLHEKSGKEDLQVKQDDSKTKENEAVTHLAEIAKQKVAEDIENICDVKEINKEFNRLNDGQTSENREIINDIKVHNITNKNLEENMMDSEFSEVVEKGTKVERTEVETKTNVENILDNVVINKTNNDPKIKSKNQQKNSKAQKENLEEVTFKLHVRLHERHLVQSTLTTDSKYLEKQNSEKNSQECTSSTSISNNYEQNKKDSPSRITKDLKVVEKIDKENKDSSQAESKVSLIDDTPIHNKEREYEKNGVTSILDIVENEKDGDNALKKENERRYKRKRSCDVISSRVLRSASKRNSLSENDKYDNDNTLLESHKINLVHSFCNEEVPVLHLNGTKTYSEMLKDGLNLPSFEANNENISLSIAENNKNSITNSNVSSSVNDSRICSPPRRKRRKVIITMDD